MRVEMGFWVKPPPWILLGVMLLYCPGSPFARVNVMFKRLSMSILLVLAALGFLFCHGARAEVLFDGEWDGFGGPFMSTHWHGVQEKELGRIAPVLDPTSPKHGVVARIEVRPGDTVLGGERAEVANMMRKDPATGKTTSFPVIESDGHEFYGLAVKLSPDWQSPGKHHGTGPVWGIFLQLHGPDVLGAPPPIELDAENEFHLGMCNGDVLDGGTRKAKGGEIYSFKNGDLKRGQWVQFMMDVIWSYDDNGRVAIYRRDEGEKDFTKVLELNNIPTLQYKFGAPKDEGQHYWKTGFYRSTTEGLTSVIWLGPLVRGTSFEDVAKTAFGAP